MKLGITNLSWDESQDSDTRNGFDYLETVFPRRNNGLYYSTQSIFYGSGVTSFEDLEATKTHLEYVIDECARCGIKVIVFGSPSLRKGNRDRLREVFDSVDGRLRENSIYLCVEPNARYYGGDYYHKLSQIVPDIEGYTNIKTMIDSHNVLLEGGNLIDTFESYREYIKHIHFSEKDLVPITDYSKLTEFTSHLLKSGYEYGITYELKKTENLDEHATEFLCAIMYTKNSVCNE